MTIRSTQQAFRRLALAAAVSAAFAGTAQAATTWNFSNCKINSTGGGWSSCGAGQPEFRAVSTGMSGGAATVDSIVGPYDTGLGVRSKNTSGTIESDSNGPHAVDNYNGLDALIFKFSGAVILTDIGIGWNGYDNAVTYNSGTTNQTKYNDSDLSVYVWEKTDAPTNFSKTSDGWKWVSDHMDVGQSNGLIAGGSASLSTTLISSYWLITAYGTGTKGANSSIDAFKLASLTTSTGGSSVPEPGSLALLGLGAASLLAARRKAMARR